MLKFGQNQINDEMLAGHGSNHSSQNIRNQSQDFPSSPFEEVFPTANQLLKTTTTTKHGKMIFVGGEEVAHLNADELVKIVASEDKVKEKHERERAPGRSNQVSSAYDGNRSNNRSVSKQRSWTNIRPWYNQEMADVIRQRDKAHKLWKRSENAKKRGENWDAFRTIRNKVCTMRHLLKNEFLISKLKLDGYTSHPWKSKQGGKIWECAQDLGDYMTKNSVENYQDCLFSGLAGRYVLDLGCGAGILGILALQAGANVHFLDYNKDVMSNITIQNVILNCTRPRQEIFHRCRFYSGDWMKYIKATLDDIEYDVILTCETIYNRDNHPKILNVLKVKLKKTGVAYLAAKTEYGGIGLREFEKVMSDDGMLQSEVIWVCTETGRREILKITHKRKSMNR